MTIIRRAPFPVQAFSERVIHVWCSGRKIAFEFPAAVTFEDLQHAVQVHMSVSNVRDLANNVLQRPVSWSFGVSDLALI